MRWHKAQAFRTQAAIRREIWVTIQHRDAFLGWALTGGWVKSRTWLLVWWALGETRRRVSCRTCQMGEKNQIFKTSSKRIPAMLLANGCGQICLQGLRPTVRLVMEDQPRHICLQCALLDPGLQCKDCVPSWWVRLRDHWLVLKEKDFQGQTPVGTLRFPLALDCFPEN